MLRRRSAVSCPAAARRRSGLAARSMRSSKPAIAASSRSTARTRWRSAASTSMSAAPTRSARAMRAGASPSGRDSGRLWAKMHKRRSTRRRTCRTGRSTRSSARSMSSASRSGPTATSPTWACCSTGRAPRQFLGVEGGEVQRSVPMLLIPVMVIGGHRDQRRAAQCVAARLGAVPHVAKPDRLCPGQRHGVDPMLINAAQTARPGRGWWRNHPRSVRRGRHPRRRGAAAAALSGRAGAGAVHRAPWSGQ